MVSESRKFRRLSWFVLNRCFRMSLRPLNRLPARPLLVDDVASVSVDELVGDGDAASAVEEEVDGRRRGRGVSNAAGGGSVSRSMIGIFVVEIEPNVDLFIRKS